MTKKSWLCLLLMIVNLLYALFMIRELEWPINKANFNVLYVPGIIFALLIFPLANFSLWKIKERIIWVDYTLFIMPLSLWLLIVPGGSFTNFLFVNFPLIWTVSMLYLIRFGKIVKDKNVYIVVLFLWLSITVILLAVNTFIPILPE